MKHILLTLYIALVSYCAFAQTFTFKYSENEDPLIFLKTGNVYVQFKKQTSLLGKEIFLKSLSDNGIETENINADIVKLQTSTSGFDHRNLSSILSNEIVLCSSDELIYPVDSTIQWAGNDIFVHLKSGVKIEDLLGSLSFPYTSYYNWNRYDDSEYIVSIANYDAFEYASMLLNSGNVEYAVPSFHRKGILQNPNYSNQWNLKNTGQYCNTSGIDIKAEGAWTISTGSGIKVAVIDNGVQLNHTDLSGNLLPGFDAFDGTTNGGQVYPDYHGTNCAGVIAAIDNNIQIKGIAYNSKIIPIRMNEGEDLYDICFVNAMSFAVNNDADIINCSWSGGSPVPSITNAINSAVTNGRNGKGCVVAVSSGNSYNPLAIPNNVLYPATLSNVIAVGAIAPSGKRKSFTSCDDENWASCYGDELDVVAPGVFIPTTTIGNGYTGYFNGTSAAAPHVSGVAALMLSVNPYLTAAQVKTIIEQTAQKVGDYNYQTTTGRPNGTWCKKTGYGLINAHAAVAAACYYGYEITGPSTIDDACQEYTFSLNQPLPPGVLTSWYTPNCVEVVSETATSIVVRPVANAQLITIMITLYRPGYYIDLEKYVTFNINNFSCEHNYSSTTDRTISTPTNISGTFTINSGHTVTITSQVKCMPDTKIVINSGGKLIVDGGTISNYCTGRTWDAIYVVGNTYQRQLAQHQGTLEVKNNSVIENSSWGIVTWNGTSYSTTGGIVQCTNSTFRNNGRQVEFYPYTNHNASNEECNNVSYFKNCNFTIDNNNLFSSSNVTYTDMIKMSGVRGISIRGCHFSDNRTGMPARGSAIRIAGASANIKPSCSFGDYTPNLPCNCTGESRNTFYCFTKGIDVENTGSNYSFYVFKTDFEKCKQSVYASAVNNYNITMSDMNLTGVESLSPANGYGIYSSNCTGYKIEGNSIYTTNASSVFCQTNGIYMHNSGVDNIYRNTFEKLDRGIYSDSNPGLLISCNEFSNIFNNDIKTAGFVCHQGTSSTGAGNQFTAGVLNIETDNTNYPTYYFSGQANSSNPYYPASVQGSITRTSSSAANECNPTICIVPIYPPINPPIVGPILGNSAPENNDITLYESLQQIYDSRLAEYNNAGYGFLLENFEENDADIVAVARLKQDTLISIHRAMAEIANRNIDAIFEDTVVFDRESLNGWYNRINTQTAKYSLVNSYFEVGEYALARQELAAIPQRFVLSNDELAEYDNFCQYQSLRESVYSSGRNYAQLTEDEIAELQTIVERNTGVSSAYANSVLCFFYGICRDEEMDIDFDIDAPMNSKSTTEVVEENAEPLAIYVYPNPADEELNILLNSLPEGKTMIEFHDVTGRLVLSEEIKGNSTSINISSLRQGVYMYRIVNGDNVIARDRIVKE